MHMFHYLDTRNDVKLLAINQGSVILNQVATLLEFGEFLR